MYIELHYSHNYHRSNQFKVVFNYRCTVPVWTCIGFLQSVSSTQPQDGSACPSQTFKTRQKILKLLCQVNSQHWCLIDYICITVIRVIFARHILDQSYSCLPRSWLIVYFMWAEWLGVIDIMPFRQMTRLSYYSAYCQRLLVDPENNHTKVFQS